jgi:hypothetical protein
MWPRSDSVVRGIKGLAGAAVDAARRSAPPRAWRLGVEALTSLMGLVRPLDSSIHACKEALRKELEELRLAAGEVVRTRNGLIQAEDIESYLKEEDYLPPGCERTWEGRVVLSIDVTHPNPSAAPEPWCVLPAAMGRFTAFRWETFDRSGQALSEGAYPVPRAGYPNTMLKMIAAQTAFTFAQDGPEAWAGLWE